MSARVPPLGEALAARARTDLAALALAVAVLTAVSLADPLIAVLQAPAALAVVLLGARAERLRLPLPGRLALIAAVGAFAWLPTGDAPTILARFLSGLVAASLLRPKPTREHGFVVLLLLLETSLAAALSLHWGAAPAGVLLAVLFHRAVGSWHRQRSAARAAAGGGPVVRPEDPRRLRRSADVAALTALLLAAPIFLVLPRTAFPLLRFPLAGGRTEPGVGEEVRLGRLGPIGDAEQVIGRVAPQDTAARDAPTYFRAVVLDRFDGTRWSPSDAVPSHRASYDLAVATVEMGRRAAAAPAWLFVVDTAAAPRLPLPEGVARVRFEDPAPRTVRVDAAETLRPTMDRAALRWTYTAFAAASGAESAGPPTPSDASRAPGPETLRRELAEPVAAAITNVPETAVRERARRLEAWVRSSATYDLFGGPGGENPVGDFLFRAKRGHCEHFASALAMALREVGIASRLVAGYHASRWNDVGGFWVLRRRDAHAWVEAWIPGDGWTRFDATPAAVRDADPYAGLAGFFSRLRDAASYAWNRTVVGYDRDAQQGALGALRDLVARTAPSARRGGVALVLVLAAAGLSALAMVARRRRRRTGRKRVQGGGAGFYAEALVALKRLGLERGGAETPAELAVRVLPRLSPVAAEAFEALTVAHARTLYGAEVPPASQVTDAWLARLTLAPRVSARQHAPVKWTGGPRGPTLSSFPTEVRTDGSEQPTGQEGEPRSPTL